MLPKLREWLKDIAQTAGFSVEATQLVLLVVEEMAANITEHGYGNRPGEPLWVTARTDSRGLLEIVIEDAAPEYDWESVPELDLHELALEGATRGRGRPLARLLTRDIGHRHRPDGGNELSLRFDAVTLERRLKERES